MSASEKLKTLEAQSSPAPWKAEPWREDESLSLQGAEGFLLWGYDDEFENPDDARLIVALRNALPQIVAVVEAAEERQTYLRQLAYGPPFPSVHAGDENQRKMRAALSALEEALS